jgi:hypothetical protein
MVRSCVIATNARRPHLDPASAAATGDYAQRWSPQRAGWLWDCPDYREPVITEDQLADPATTASTTPGTPGAQPAGPIARDGGLNLSYKRNNTPPEDVDTLAKRFMDEIDARYGTTDEPGTPPASGLNLSYKRTDKNDKVDPRRALIRDLVAGAGPAGVENDDIYTALNIRFGTDGWDRSTVATWITKDCQAGIMHRPDRGRVAPGAKPMDEQGGA